MEKPQGQIVYQIKVFKIIVLIIVNDLIKAASYCFINGIIPESLKEFITVVLHKKGKKDYFFLSSYKLVIFKNILTKVLKKYVANIILKAIEKYGLLL